MISPFTVKLPVRTEVCPGASCAIQNRSIFFSFTIAGPLIRIERVLKEIGQGKFDVNVKLRNYDELKDLAEVINVMAKDLRNMRDAERQKLAEISAKLEKLKGSGAPGPEIESIISELKSLTERA